MQTEAPRKPWYRRTRYIVILGVLAILLVASFVQYAYRAPVTGNQFRLNKVVDYFANNYDVTTGLIAESPGSHTYWLYSDNYLAVLALERYDPGNSSTISFSAAVDVALRGYLATAPESLGQNQYSALNSTSAYFDCSADFAISWTRAGMPVGGNGSTVVMTTANSQNPSCASQNYADLLLLRAIHEQEVGNTTGALALYRLAANDFDGYGFRDLANINVSTYSPSAYQTYKLALFVYATYFFGQQRSSPQLQPALGALFFLQSNSTGGFTTGYSRNSLALGLGITPSGGVNTETTALAALALEELMKSSSS